MLEVEISRHQVIEQILIVSRNEMSPKILDVSFYFF